MTDTPAGLDAITFRVVRYDDERELRAYLRIFWDLPAQQNPYFEPRSDAFVARWAEAARERETVQDTHAGVALHEERIVGLHLLRRFEEYEGCGAHIAGLWVDPTYRRMGIARRLKQQGEAWARSVGATFLNTNVMPDNDAMLRLNAAEGFRVFRLNQRKKL